MQPRSMPGDSPARFLGELRVLRDEAGVDHAELAIRAHYPVDVMVAAEAGPSLPDLPVLSAYVRACGGAPGEWEDRWRALTGAAGDSDLPSRPVGGSAAARAGARAGATAAMPEDHDPAQIIEVLSRVVSASGSSSHASAGPAAGSGSGPGLGSAFDPGAGDASASSFWDASTSSVWDTPSPGLGAEPDPTPWDASTSSVWDTPSPGLGAEPDPSPWDAPDPSPWDASTPGLGDPPSRGLWDAYSPSLGSASDPGVGEASTSGSWDAPDPAALNGHWGSNVPDANAPGADVSSPYARHSPIPVPSTPPPVPSAVPARAPFAPPDRPAASSPVRAGASQHRESPVDRGGAGGRTASAQAAALLASARAMRGRRLPTSYAVVLVVVATLICVAILVAVVS